MGWNTPTLERSASFRLWKGWHRMYWISVGQQHMGNDAMQARGQRGRRHAAALMLGAALWLGGCATVSEYNPFAGDDTAAPVAQTVPNATPDSRGVISYATYQVVVAREGDT